MMSKERADQIAGGVFMIGLALLFLGVFPFGFFPGILLVIGASSIARGVAEGRAWHNATGGLWMVGLGLMFWLGFRWELLLILVGVSMLFGYQKRGSSEYVFEDEDDEILEKLKNDEKRKNDLDYDYVDDDMQDAQYI